MGLKYKNNPLNRCWLRLQQIIGKLGGINLVRKKNVFVQDVLLALRGGNMPDPACPAQMAMGDSGVDVCSWTGNICDHEDGATEYATCARLEIGKAEQRRDDFREQFIKEVA